MFQLSEGSAPAEFALISGPLLVSFTLAMAIPLLGFEKSQLTAAASAIAERVARADVSESEVEVVSQSVLSHLGLDGASVSVMSSDGIETVRLSLMTIPGLSIEAVGYAVTER